LRLLWPIVTVDDHLQDSMRSPPIQRPAPPTSSEPALVYRVTGRLNRLVWRAPLPRRVLVRLSGLVYRNPPMMSESVLAIVDALRAAEVRCWISGGWGVDALAGKRTRVHRDLDLVIEARDRQRAVGVLEGLGYGEWYRVDSDVPLFSRIVLHDHELAGRAVDLHPLDLASAQVEFTTGTIEGRPVPCLSLDLQVKTHANYRKRWRDRADLAVLRKLREGSATTLIVPVPSAEGVLQKSAREVGVPAHITLLYPFLAVRMIDSDIESTLASLLREVPPFDFALSEVGRFPGVVYLAPKPAAPFVALTRALAERWPGHQPYGGAHEEVIPHLTVAYGEITPSGLVEQLPMTARAEEVWLMSRLDGRWVRRRNFPLGSPPPPTVQALNGPSSPHS
jgi:2'-5' RNA ligase superfamily/Aminoglycoside-2''-adenylyltransferase